MAVFTVPTDFLVTVCGRLVATAAPAAERLAALSLLAVILAQLEPQTYACRLSLPDLALQLAMSPAELIAAARLLGRVDAIVLSDRRGGRRIAVHVPSGPQRGPRRHYPGSEIAIGARTFGV